MNDPIDEKEIIDHKKNLKMYFRAIVNYTCIITAIGLFSVVILWASKELSYLFIYEDMVRQTVIDLVKPEYLRDYIK